MSKAKKLITIIVLSSTVNTVAIVFDSRVLERAEILQIFHTLTDHPKDTWVPAGTIESTHIAYEASSGYATNSTEVVKYDGDKFYWEININSQTAETEPQGQLHSSFDLNQNRKRIFTWDGQRYTMYFRSGNYAIVTEDPSNAAGVNGPLTAGIIPWGYGFYTLENLSAAESSGELDDEGLVHLTVNKANGLEIVFVLDPTKDYAVLSCVINHTGYSSIIKTYGDYSYLSYGRWVPNVIIIERYDDSKETPKLLSRDEWYLTLLGTDLPQPDSFSIVYEPNALVEYYLPDVDNPLSYYHSVEIDTDVLLEQRVEILAKSSISGAPAQNCATISLKYVAAQLGCQITDQQLAELINEPNEGTSLYTLQDFTRGLGFYCLAAETDLASLKNLNDCQAILHLPRANHYVVLEHIDDEYVWVIDLDDNKFYYRLEQTQFGLNWSGGTALLISNEPLNGPKENFTALDDNRLHQISGSFTSPKYSCTDLIQRGGVLFCEEMMGGLCGSTYIQFYDRYGCEEDPGGDTCTGQDLVGNAWSICIENPEYPGDCITSSNWYGQYIRACK